MTATDKGPVALKVILQKYSNGLEDTWTLHRSTVKEFIKKAPAEHEIDQVIEKTHKETQKIHGAEDRRSEYRKLIAKNLLFLESG